MQSSNSRLQDFWKDHSIWSQATFGTDAERGPIGALKHLAKEAVEAQDPTADKYEIADCFILTCDAARRSGLTPDELMTLVEQKLVINKARSWPRPVDDEPVEHIRD